MANRPRFNLLTGSSMSGILKLIALAAAFLFLLFAMGIYLPPAIDWEQAFRPASRLLLSGRSPYQVERFFNPPWALLPLIPFSLLPPDYGRALLLICALISYSYVGYRFGADGKSLVVLLLAPPLVHGYLNGSIDWLAALGLVMRPQLGLFFVMMKPQIGTAIAIYWAVEAWREGGWTVLVRVVGPFVAATGLSFLVFGPWPLRFERGLGVAWNASLWPLSIPIGLTLLAVSLRERRLKFVLPASPCLSPYLAFHGWAIALLPLSSSFLYMSTAVLGLWIAVAIQSV